MTEGVLAAILIAMALPKHKARGKVVFDIPGMATMIAGVVVLLLALTFGGVNGTFFRYGSTFLDISENSGPAFRYIRLS